MSGGTRSRRGGSPTKLKERDQEKKEGARDWFLGETTRVAHRLAFREKCRRTAI